MNWKLWPQKMIPEKSISNEILALNVGETAVTSSPNQIVCYGLGSCVGVFLYDKFKKIGAGAHIVLPASSRNSDSDQMLKEIINGMLALGANILTIRAKIVGGADIMNISSYQIGQRNITYIKGKLKESGIMIIAEDTGGTKSRTARLNTENGSLQINNSEQKYYTI